MKDTWHARSEGARAGGQKFTHASHDLEKLLSVGLWESSRGVHLVDDEGHVAGAELLDEEVAEKVIVARKVAHVHDLGWTPLTLEDGRAGARHRGGHGVGQGPDASARGRCEGEIYRRGRGRRRGVG